MEAEAPGHVDPTTNRNFALGVLGGVLVVLLAVVGWNSLTGSDDTAASAPTPAEVAAAGADRLQALEQTLASTLEDDRQWADAMETQIAEAIATDLTISPHRDLDISCAADLCRVVAVVPDAELNPVIADGFWLPVTRAGGTEAPDALAWPSPTGDGSLEIQVWLAREGRADVLAG